MLLVTVTDAVGNTGTLLEAPIEVLDPVPPGSNTVTVTATSGTVTHTATLALVVR